MSVEQQIGPRQRKQDLPVESGVAVVLFLIVAWLSWRFPGFRTGANGSVILSSGAEVAIVAAGMTLVIATGGIDISVGSIVGLCGVAIGIFTAKSGWSIPLASAAAIGIGAACGLVNGVLISRWKLPPIIATLAMFSAARAGAYILSRGDTISGLPPSIISLGYDNFLGIPIAAWISAGALLAVGVVLKRTAFGRAVKALGGNREASYLSGLKILRIETAVYVISGALAGLSSVVVTARAASAVPDAGRFFELSAITAVVVGGTPVTGGRATIIGTALGLVTIGVVANGVRSYGLDDVWVQLVLGITLLSAVEVDRWRARRAARA